MKTKERKIGNKITKTAGAASLRRNLVIGLVALFIGCFALPANAQCEAKNDAFQSGEHVMYDLYFNWKFVWVKVYSQSDNQCDYLSLRTCIPCQSACFRQ